MVHTQIMSWAAARAEAGPIRFTVFVDEQKVPAEIELDAYDEISLHVVARVEGRAVGTGRLLPIEVREPYPVSHIGRMAVLKPWRGRGVGAAMLRALMDAAQARGDAEIVLSAQTHAIGFYRGFGFVEFGPEYPDAGIAHQDMRLMLGAPRRAGPPASAA